MSIKCRDVTYNGNETMKWKCTEIGYCDIPADERAGPCICAFGYKNLTDGTCVLSCPNTTHNGNSSICSAMTNCEMTTGSTNCSCKPGFYMNKYGDCETPCKNTIYDGTNICTRKVGCENPDRN